LNKRLGKVKTYKILLTYQRKRDDYDFWNYMDEKMKKIYNIDMLLKEIDWVRNYMYLIYLSECMFVYVWYKVV